MQVATPELNLEDLYTRVAGAVIGWLREWKDVPKGSQLNVEFPVHTVVRDVESGEVIFDLQDATRESTAMLPTHPRVVSRDAYDELFSANAELRSRLEEARELLVSAWDHVPKDLNARILAHVSISESAANGGMNDNG